jgi:hypothetical protein
LESIRRWHKEELWNQRTQRNVREGKAEEKKEEGSDGG